MFREVNAQHCELCNTLIPTSPDAAWPPHLQFLRPHGTSATRFAPTPPHPTPPRVVLPPSTATHGALLAQRCRDYFISILYVCHRPHNSNMEERDVKNYIVERNGQGKERAGDNGEWRIWDWEALLLYSAMSLLQYLMRIVVGAILSFTMGIIFNCCTTICIF